MVLRPAGIGQPKKQVVRPRLQVNTRIIINERQRRHLTDKTAKGALVDSGANGNVVGDDVSIPWLTDRYIDMSGIQDHTVNDLRVVHAAAVAKSDVGDTIVHMPESAHLPGGKTILSGTQMEAQGTTFVTTSQVLNNGLPPYVRSTDGYIFPLRVKDGLAYMDIRPVLDSEWDTLPHTYLTKDEPWNPKKYDHDVDPDWLSKMPANEDPLAELPFDREGRIKVADEDRVEDLEGEDLEVPPALVNSATTRNTHGYCSDDSSIEDGESTGGALVVNRAVIEAHLTSLIEDELVTSETESLTDDEGYYFPYHDDSDGEHHWEPQFEANASWFCYEGNRRSRRARKDVDYSETKRRKKKTDTQPTVTAKPKRKRRYPAVEQYISPTLVPEKVLERDPTVDDIPAVETVLDEEDDQGSVGSDNSEPRTDYNNPAKSTLQNEADDVKAALRSGPFNITPNEENYHELAKFFGGAPLPTLKKTFKATTQLGRLGAVRGMRLYQRRKAPNPALNIPRRNEPVATDMILAGVPAVDDGSTAASLFIGRKSGFCGTESLGASDKRFPTALMNHIRKYGAMDQLISDHAAAQVSTRVEEILGILGIKQFVSEPHNKNQNFAERVWQQLKGMVIKILNMSDAPSELWLCALEYACFIMNHTAMERLNWRTPTEWLLGYTPDITVLLQFHFWEPVYYAKVEPANLENTDELLGRFVGIADTVGNAVSYKILTESKKIITRSVVRSAAKGGAFQNLRANREAPNLAPKEPNRLVLLREEEIPIVAPATATDPTGEEPPEEPIPTEPEVTDEDAPEGVGGEVPEDTTPRTLEETIRSAMEHIIQQGGSLPTLNAAKLMGRTFITLPDSNEEQHRAKIEDIEASGEMTPDKKQPLFKFKCSVGEKKFEEIMTYNRMLEWVERDKDLNDHFRLLAIQGHKKFNGDWYVLVLWANGKRTWNRLSTTIRDDPITVALYAQRNGLLDEKGFKDLKKYVKNRKTLGRMVNQVRLKNFRMAPRYKYGHQVPRNHEEAVLIDEKNGNTKWQDSEKLEIQQLNDYSTFRSLGKGAPVPEGYTKIPCHMIYDVKFDGRFKCRLVAGGHRTDTPIDSVYSGVVSLRGIRMVTFLAELNGLDLWSTDVGNAYLESHTKEKVVFIAGDEFGEYAGHTMVIEKAQYGLKSSGKCWHDRLHDVLRDLGFKPSKAEEDIWMRDMGDHYEYIAVYVDDLMIASKNPQAIIDALEGKPINFKLKGTGPVEFHLGCNFFRDEDGTLCLAPTKYIERMVDGYRTMFGTAPKQNIQSPIEANDHPELDDSPLLDEDGIKKYQSLIGALQWTISLGRFDIATAVMTLSSFRVAPRVGHLERLKRICGYLSKFKHACIRVRTEVPDYSDLPVQSNDWLRSVYGRVREQRPSDAPPPKGKLVRTTTYKDANLYHDLATGRAVTGILHFLNGTPIDWYTKKQPTVETATYGSEFAAAKVAIQQIADLRITLQYLGVPIERSAYLFGDNESVVKSSTLPQSQLSKRHHALAYHFTREAIASEMVVLNHIPGKINPADILSKHWSHAAVYPMLRPLFFYRGDTLDLITDED